MELTGVVPHKIDVVLDKFNLLLVLVCPGPGKCNAFFACAECEGSGTVEDEEEWESDCPDCNGTGASDDICGLADWFENTQPEELYDGPAVNLSTLTLPAEIVITSWQTDEPPQWEFAAVKS